MIDKNWLALPGALARKLTLIALVCAAIVGVIGVSGASGVDHPGVPPETPRTMDRVLTTPFNGDEPRQVFASTIVGSHIIVGGDFLNIDLRNGDSVRQPYLAAFDINTGRFVDDFRPVLDGPVLALEPANDGFSVFVGGQFNRVDDTYRGRLAKLNAADGTLDRNWYAPASARVAVLDLSDDGRLFVGGGFTEIDGARISHLAEISEATGQVNTRFDFDFDGPSTPILDVGVTADGRRLAVVHRADDVDGIRARGTLVIDISNQNSPSITGHRLRDGGQSEYIYEGSRNITAGAVSDDGSLMALTIRRPNDVRARGVYLVPTTTRTTDIRWFHAVGKDSVYGLGISDEAVYATGHFCRIASGPGRTDNSYNQFDNNCRDGISTTWRAGLAAFDIDDGTPLPWDPGTSIDGVGGQSVTIIDRGVLIGFDGEHVGPRGGDRRTGSLAFFDFGGPWVPPIDVPEPPAAQTCTATLDDNGSLRLAWTAIVGENSYQVRNVNGTRWYASVGDARSFAVPAGDAGTGPFAIRSRQNGTTTDTACPG